MSDNDANARAYAEWEADTVLAVAAHRGEFPALDDCPDHECYLCGFQECPHKEPLHFHHDGCPACSQDVGKHLSP